MAADEDIDEEDAPAALEATVPETLDRERLDRALATLFPDHTRAALQRWIEADRVRLDGKPARASAKVRTGMAISALPPPPEPTDAIPEDIPISILFEDAHVVVIDKPAGLVVHPAAGHASGTLVNALVFRYGSLAGEASRPGIVHRLDKDTSGVMVVARTAAAHDALAQRFAAHDVERSYLAIALGSVPKATYDTLHGRHPTDRKRFSGRVTRGRRAVTHVEPIEDLHGATLVRCRLETGRTHQIRVHLSEAGHPILGDAAYGRVPSDARLRAASERVGRQALHAAVLGFPHPATGEHLRFESPAPPDLAGALDGLRSG